MPTLLYGLDIQEVSSVDNGAGEGVQIMLMKKFVSDPPEVIEYMKRSFSADQRKKDASSGVAMQDGSFPIENTTDLKNAILAVGRASDPAAAKAHIQARAQALGATSQLPSSWSGGKKLTVDCDPEGGVTITHRPEKGGKAVEKADTFATRLLSKLGFKKAADALQKSVTSIANDPEVVDKSGSISESLAQFVEHISKSTPGAFAAAARDVPDGGIQEDDEMSKELLEKIAKLESDVKEMNTALAKSNELLALATLEPEEQAYLKKHNIKGDDALAFAKMSPADKKKKMQDAKDAKNDDDDADDVEKRELKKNLADAQTRLAKLEKAEQLESFKKRAVSLGLEENFGEVLMKARDGDTVAIEKMETELKALREQVTVGGIFKEFGSRGGSSQAGTVEAEMDAKVAELRKSQPKLSYEQAYARVYESPDNVDLVKRLKAGK